MTKPESEHSEDAPEPLLKGVADLLKTAHKGDAAASVFAGAVLISLLAALALVLWLIKTLWAIV
jgi:fatty acid desaturase